MKQLELKFNKESEEIENIKKDIPDFIKNGFTNKEDFDKAKNFDREWHYMNKSIKGKK